MKPSTAPAELPDAGSQACPRSLRLLPDRLPIPAATLAILLRRGPLRFEYAGWGLLPAVPDGAVVTVAAGGAPRRGDLALCNRSGGVDLLRLVEPDPAGGWLAMLDGYPRRRMALDADRLLGVATLVDGAPPGPAWSLCASHLGYGALRLALRRVTAAPVWETAATDSVLDKYASQVEGYLEKRQSNLTREHLDLMAARAGPGARVLVAGCGVGSEALHLARLGYRVTAFDAIPEMIATARRLATEAGLEMRFSVADARRGDWPVGPYDAVYMTPLLYSFVCGREARVAFLRRLGRALRPGGAVLYSVRLFDGARAWIETRIVACRARWSPAAPGGEPGDWYTRYLRPDGSIGTSYLRRFDSEEVRREARAAGFGAIERLGAHFVASRHLSD